MSYRIENKAIVISGFEKGIGDSPYAGTADMRNVELLTIPGEASVSLATDTVTKPPVYTGVSFSASAATDTFTVATTAGMYPGVAVTLDTIVIPQSVSYLVVGGGGGAGGALAGTVGNGAANGGGGGQVLTGTHSVVGGTTYPVVIGTGGAGHAAVSSGVATGTNGVASSAFGTTAASGKGGTGGSDAMTAGGNSGSGHTGGIWNTVGGQGGGGAGDSANGTNGSGGGLGGAGTASSLSGASVTYGGGGGGGENTGNGGAGGGGNGGNNAGTPGADGTANSGGGGGGGFSDNGPTSASGAGGSGVVIISYPTGTISATGGTITTSGGNTIHTFTSSGDFVVSSGLSTGVAYYVQNITPTTFQLSLGAANTTPIDVLSSVTGTLSTISYRDANSPVDYVPDTSGLMNGLNSVIITDSNAHTWAIFQEAVVDIPANSLIFLGNTGGVAASGAKTPNGVNVWNGYLFLLGSATSGTDVANGNLLLINAASAWTYTWERLDTLGVGSKIPTLVTRDFNNLYWVSSTGLDSLTLTPAAALTLTGSLSSGATGGTLTSAWGGGTTTALVQFSNGNQRVVQFTASSTAITWSGPLSSTASANITVLSGAFNPANPLSYTINRQVVTITGTDHPTCLAQLGQNVLIGGQGAFVYVWNQVDPSFSSMINLPDHYTVKIVATSQNAYVFAGNKGRIFITNGSGMQLYKKIDEYITGSLNSYIQWQDASFGRNQVYFSFTASTASNVTVNTVSGAWVIDLDQDAFRMMNKTSNTGYTGTTVMVVQRPPQVSSNQGEGMVGNNMLIGWIDGSNSAINFSTANPYTNYESYIDTEMIPVGTFLEVFTPARVEWKTSAPLVTGEGIKISYRKNIHDSWTQIGESLGASLPADAISDLYKANFQKAQWVQFRIEMKSTATTPSLVRLTEMRISDWPSDTKMR